MDEIEITCLCSRVQVQDLNLNLTKGQVAHVSEADANRSAELTLIWKAGGVRKRRVQRFTERRQKPQQVMKSGSPRRPPSRPRKVQQPVGLRQQPAVLAPAVDLDLEDLAQRVVDKLIPVVQRAVSQRSLYKGVQVSPQLLEGEEQFSVPDTPAFIPSGILRVDSESSVQVEARETEAPGVEAAAAALKKAKPKAKRKTKTQKKSE